MIPVGATVQVAATGYRRTKFSTALGTAIGIWVLPSSMWLRRGTKISTRTSTIL